MSKQEVCGWIPVGERLPSENGRYLVMYKRDLVLEALELHDWEPRIMRYFTDTGWRLPYVCPEEIRKAQRQSVTHWMPLPEAPA